MNPANTPDCAAASAQTDGIPVSNAYRVAVDGKPVTVCEMPTRYGQPYKDGQPLSVYDGTPLRQPM